jgi:hypothetical protein
MSTRDEMLAALAMFGVLATAVLIGIVATVIGG